MAIENLTIYPKVDSGDDLTVTPSTCVYDTLQRNKEAHLTFDFGVGAITAAVSISFLQLVSASTAGSLTMLWGFANALDDALGLINANEKFVTVFDNPPSINVNRPILRYYKDSGTLWQDFTASLPRNNERAYEVSRSGNTYTCIIYTDAGKGTIEDTLTITPVDTIPDFRYNYALASYNSGTTQSQTGYTKNFELSGFPTISAIPVHVFKRGR